MKRRRAKDPAAFDKVHGKDASFAEETGGTSGGRFCNCTLLSGVISHKAEIAVTIANVSHITRYTSPYLHSVGYTSPYLHSVCYTAPYLHSVRKLCASVQSRAACAVL